jgi:hypothetical protein
MPSLAGRRTLPAGRRDCSGRSTANRFGHPDAFERRRSAQRAPSVASSGSSVAPRESPTGTIDHGAGTAVRDRDPIVCDFSHQKMEGFYLVPEPLRR